MWIDSFVHTRKTQLTATWRCDGIVFRLREIQDGASSEGNAGLSMTATFCMDARIALTSGLLSGLLHVRGTICATEARDLVRAELRGV